MNGRHLRASAFRTSDWDKPNWFDASLEGGAASPSPWTCHLFARPRRRTGRHVAALATYIAGLCDHSDALVPGERGVLLCVALDQRVAKIILDYAEACFERSLILKQLIASRTADALELTNGITLEVRPASFRKLRGPTYIAVIADELAFWYVDAAYANPDVEPLRPSND